MVISAIIIALRNILEMLKNRKTCTLCPLRYITVDTFVTIFADARLEKILQINFMSHEFVRTDFACTEIVPQQL